MAIQWHFLLRYMIVYYFYYYKSIFPVFRFSQIDRTKASKALISSDHRRQSLPLSSKRRCSSLKLERRGTIRRDSRVPLVGTPTDGMLGRKREDGIITATDSEHRERDSLAEQKGDTLASAGTESQSEQPPDSVTDQRDIAFTTEQGPPAVRRNTLFPDQDYTNAAQSQEKADDKSSPKEQPTKNDVTQVQGKTDDNSLKLHTGGGTGLQVLNEVKNIVQESGTMPSEDQIKEQVTVMAQLAIDSKYFILIILKIKNFIIRTVAEMFSSPPPHPPLLYIFASQFPSISSEKSVNRH